MNKEKSFFSFHPCSDMQSLPFEEGISHLWLSLLDANTSPTSGDLDYLMKKTGKIFIVASNLYCKYWLAKRARG